MLGLWDQAFMANLVYPPGDPLGFWTSDTCMSESGQADKTCEQHKKYIRALFHLVWMFHCFSSKIEAPLFFQHQRLSCL